MNILGISCFYHDAAAAVIRDGVLLAAAEEERFSRKKHDFGFPSHAARFCLERAQLAIGDIDYVVFYEKPFLKFERILFSILATYPQSWGVFREAMISWLSEKLWTKSYIREKLGVPESKILFTGHHMSHAASAFFCSPFREAAILTIDGVGEWSTATCGRARADWNGGGENYIRLESEIRFPHSLGLLYSAFTAFLGFEVNEGEYKVMGMAPYGEPKYADKVYKLIRVYDDGSFELDLSYFSFHYDRKQTYSSKFVNLFGQPRNAQSRFVTAKAPPAVDDADLIPPARRRAAFQPSEEEIRRNQYYADVAASVQKVTEDVLVRLASNLRRTTGLRQLCLAGGVALNSVANYRILTESGFDEIFIQPAAGDAGAAIGAALYVYHVVLGKPRVFKMEHAFWGQDHGQAAVSDFLRAGNIAHETIDDEGRLVERTVELLRKGKVIGWYQGPFEWGPRALGHRSIIADARDPRMKDKVNVKIKFREPFRPFAPSVLEDRCHDFFELPDPARHYPARFMLYVAPVKKEQQPRVPAITHVDGTGRLQTVSRAGNPRYYRLIEQFGQATGVPLILNTSFNLRSEPIVNTPANAFSTFSRSDMDALVMENTIVLKP